MKTNKSTMADEPLKYEIDRLLEELIIRTEKMESRLREIEENTGEFWRARTNSGRRKNESGTG